MTMSNVDHNVGAVFTGKVVVDQPKQAATVVNLDTTPLVDGMRDLTRALDQLTRQSGVNTSALVAALKDTKPPSVILEPTIEVSAPEIHIPEPKVIIQRVDGQIVTQNLQVKKIYLLLLVLPYAYIVYEIIRRLT